MKARPVQRPDCRAIGAKPCEAGGLAWLEGAEFGHVDQQGERGQAGDAWNAEQDFEAAGQVVIGLDAAFNFGLDGDELAFDLRQAVGVVALEQRQADDLGAVLGGGAVLDQRRAGDVELLQVGEALVLGGTDLEWQQRPHPGQQGGIEAVGLGQLADRLGEAAGLPGIDLDDGQAALGQGALELAMIRSGGLEDHAVDVLADPGDQGLMACWRVGELPAYAVRKAVDVERVFRNINADGSVVHLFRASACHSGRDPGYPFRPKEKTRVIQL